MRKRIYKGLSFTCGLFSTVLASLVIIGWFTQNITLIQVLPSFVPMQFNTALGFLFCGISLLTRLKGKRYLGACLALLALLIGLITLAEYVLKIDLIVDQLLMSHYITVETSHPGRMAPNTALCFSLTGLALLGLQMPRRGFNNYGLIAVLGSLVLALGLIAANGYAFNLTTAYGWGRLTRMALHTSVGFIVLGIGIISYAWGKSTSRELVFPSWGYFPVGTGVLAITVSLWLALTAAPTQVITQYSLLVFGVVLSLALSATTYLLGESHNKKRELLNLNLSLESSILTLKDTQNQLVQSEKMASIGLLASGVAHELNQPITYVRGLAQIELNAHYPNLPPAVNDTLNKVVEGTDRMSIIINHLRDFSRQDQQGLNSQATAMELVNSSLTLINAQFLAHGILLNIIDNSLGAVLNVNKNRMEQVFINILTNARDAVIEVEQPNIELIINRRALALEFNFVDNGCGIASQHLDKVMNPFYTTKPEGKGTGLGMSISYNIVKEAGGVLAIKSTLNVGTRVRVTLPISLAEKLS